MTGLGHQLRVGTGPRRGPRFGPLSVLAGVGRLLFWCGGVAGRHWQNVLTAFIQIWANKARSLLTTLGIIIAVTATITSGTGTVTVAGTPELEELTKRVSESGKITLPCGRSSPQPKVPGT